MTERVVRHSPRDIFELHLAALAMNHDDPFARRAGNSRLPVSAGATERRAGSRERHVGVRAGYSEEVLVVRRDGFRTGRRAGKALCPDAQIVGDVADVRPHRPREVWVALGAPRICEQRRELLRNTRDVGERFIEPGCGRKEHFGHGSP